MLRAQHTVLLHLYHHRRYIWRNAWNDLRYRYAGTGIGVFWNLIHPLVEILLYTIVFSIMFSKRTDEISYRFYVTVGILTWYSFSEVLQRGSHAFLDNTCYLKRLAIPSEIFVTKSALISTFLLFLYYLLFLPISMMLGNSVGWEWLLLPLLLVLLQGLAFGIALVLANLQILFPDIQEIVRAFLQLWRWTLPIIYPERILPEALRRWLFLNPPYIFMRSIRRLVLESTFPGWNGWIIMIVWLSMVLYVGTLIHYKLQVEVRDAL